MNKLLVIVATSYFIYLSYVLLTVWPGVSLNSYTNTINRRRDYYHPNIARLFENKLTYHPNLLLNNLFEGLDFNRYFFASHPRERAGVNEYRMSHYLLIPFALIGVMSNSPFRRLTMLLAGISLVFITVFGSRNDNVIGLMFWPLYLAIISGVWVLKKRLLS